MAYKRTSPQPVVEGGTGDTSFTAYSVLCGGTTSTGGLQSVSGLGTSGQVLTSNGAAALPTWQPGGGGMSTVVTNTDVTHMTTNTAYILTNVWGVTNTVNLGLPVTSAVGDQIIIMSTDYSGTASFGDNGGFKITQGIGQNIIGNGNGTMGSTTIGVLGYVETSNPDTGPTLGSTVFPGSLVFFCVAANTTWELIDGTFSSSISYYVFN